MGNVVPETDLAHHRFVHSSNKQVFSTYFVNKLDTWKHV